MNANSRAATGEGVRHSGASQQAHQGGASGLTAVNLPVGHFIGAYAHDYQQRLHHPLAIQRAGDRIDRHNFSLHGGPFRARLGRVRSVIAQIGSCPDR
jgi:hypothetical protein